MKQLLFYMYNCLRLCSLEQCIYFILCQLYFSQSMQDIEHLIIIGVKSITTSLCLDKRSILEENIQSNSWKAPFTYLQITSYLMESGRLGL